MMLNWRYENLSDSGPELLLIKVNESKIFNKMASLEHVLELICIVVVLQKYSLKNFLIIHGRLIRDIFFEFTVLDFFN